MNVRELIEALQKLDPELPVTCQISEPIDEYEEVTEVEVNDGAYWVGTTRKCKYSKHVRIKE